jgi:hypothetical protein
MFTQKGDKYIYRDKEEGEVVEAEIYYTLGGQNYFSGSTNRRGVYFSFHPVTLKIEDGIKIKSFALFGNGVKFFALPLKAKSAKQVARVAAHFDPHVAGLVELYKTAPDQASKRVLELIATL